MQVRTTMLLLFRLILSIVLTHSAYHAPLIDSTLLYNDASRPPFNLVPAIDDGRVAYSRNRLTENGSASYSVNASSRRKQIVPDARIQHELAGETHVSEVSIPSHPSKFLDAVRLGRCKAKCALSLGKRQRERSGYLVSALCAMSTKCKVCEEACQVPFDKCDEHCGLRSACRIACSFRRTLTAQPETVLANSAKLASLELDRPRAICLNYTKRSITGFLFKWSLLNTTSRAYVDSYAPVVFIVEHRTRSQKNEAKPWMLEGMHSSGLASIPIDASGLHQYRVTPVTADGILPAKASHWTFASSEPGLFEAPKAVHVIRMAHSNRGLKATIALEYQGLPSCAYSIDLLPSDSRSNAHRVQRRPADLFQYELEGLDFARNYTIRVGSTDSTGRERGRSNYTRWFETPPCLDAVNHNFSVCAPGPPSMVRVEEGKRGLRVLWQPPPYTTPSNRVLAYDIQISTAQMRSPVFERTVNASVNFIDAEDADEATSYIVLVRARTEAGMGVPANVTYSWLSDSSYSPEFIASVAVVGIVSMIAAITMINYSNVSLQ